MGSTGIGLLWFIVIIAAIPLVLWLLKRSPYGAALAGGTAAPTRTVGSTSIGPQQRIVTIEVGQGDERRWLVLGVTPQHISALHTMAPQAALPSAAAGAETPFGALLKKVRDARR
jgi:flagellar protein FliO/FliZ